MLTIDTCSDKAKQRRTAWQKPTSTALLQFGCIFECGASDLCFRKHGKRQHDFPIDNLILFCVCCVFVKWAKSKPSGIHLPHDQQSFPLNHKRFHIFRNLRSWVLLRYISVQGFDPLIDRHRGNPIRHRVEICSGHPFAAALRSRGSICPANQSPCRHRFAGQPRTHNPHESTLHSDNEMAGNFYGTNERRRLGPCLHSEIQIREPLNKSG